ncbi:MAG: leucyl/phenylalanyl-tRNA--protein transferase [Pirellulales bacterium]|nr:leucyl/phenylalanyl-tRNA--protein transferase [Pirellulales bacterium]
MDLDAGENEFDELLVPVSVPESSLPPSVRFPPSRFPCPTSTTPDGLVCLGGRLSPEWLLDAYRHGIFPWPMWPDDPIAWWSPDPRAIIELSEVENHEGVFQHAVGGLHISRRLQRTLRSGKFRVTRDRCFDQVIVACATVGDRAENTWLTPNMIAAYQRMHALAHAHSVEVWSGEQLVGGTYGLAMGGLFAAESMFHLERDASKVALVHLVKHLKDRGFLLLDIQQWTPHTGRLGAAELPRSEYLRRLADALSQHVVF